MFRENCTLYVDNQIVGDAFDCKGNFTTVQWQDITNDGQEEIVIITLSYGEKTELRETCLQQHLLAYEWIGSEAVEIANIRGCVVEADLYGVRFDDLENDDQVEIVAADSWHTEPECFRDLCLGGSEWFELGHRDEIYKWDGSSFVFSGIME